MIVFDCDGVLLNSNEVKSDAFRVALSGCPQDEIEAFLEMHRATAGVSRFAKFEWMEHRAQVQGYRFDKAAALETFAKACQYGLLACEVTPGLAVARRGCDQVWAVVSGGAEQEVRQVLEHKGLSSYFAGGIHGSPQNKIELLTELSKAHDLAGSIFFGDAAYDHDSAIQFKMEFHFVWGWTEMTSWKAYCAERKTVSKTHKFVTDYFQHKEP